MNCFIFFEGADNSNGIYSYSLLIELGSTDFRSIGLIGIGTCLNLLICSLEVADSRASVSTIHIASPFLSIVVFN